MANHESTAVNALIERVAIGSPPARDEELMFAPPAKRAVAPKLSAPRVSATVPPERGAGEVAPLPRLPHGTARQPHVPREVRMSDASPRARSIPPIPMPSQSVPFKIPVAPPSASEAISMNAADSARSRLPLQSPPSHPPGYLLPIAPAAASGSAPTYLPPGTSDTWFTTSQSATIERHRDSFGSTEGTVQVTRPRSATAGLLGKLVLPMILVAVAGAGVGGYLLLDTADTSTVAAAATTEPAAVAEPPAVAAAIAPAIAPAAAAPIARAPFVDVRIDSKPAGATVMLVDRGKTTFLGTTPLDAALDPAHAVELVFTHGDRPTRVERLDPSAQKRVAVVLAVAAPAAEATPAVAAPTAPTAAEQVEPAKPAPTAADRARAERKAARAAKQAAARAAKLDARVAAVEEAAPAAKAAPAGDGVLMISSKPPCEIYIDGKPTGLLTPQRSIALAAGTHKITLVNDAAQIKKTLAVQITADKPTKVIQDLMK